MQINKVDDGPQTYPVYQVAHSPAENKTGSQKKNPIETGRSRQVEDQNGCNQRSDNKEPELPVDIGSVEDTEGSSAVAHMHKIEKT